MIKFRWRSGLPSGYRDCFRIRHYWETRKWLTDIKLLLILIRQMAALVRRALAEECTVPVVLVHFVWAFKTFNAARLMRNYRKCIVTLRMASFATEGGSVDVSLIFNYFFPLLVKMEKWMLILYFPLCIFSESKTKPGIERVQACTR